MNVKTRVGVVVSLALRLLLGTVFLAAGTAKLVSGQELMTSLTIYPGLPAWLTSFLNITVPLVEIVIGILLISGRARRFSFYAASLLTLVFIGVNGYALVTGTENNCGCLGPAVAMTHWQSLLLDLAMTGTTLYLLLSGSKPGTGAALWFRTVGTSRLTRIALTAVILAALFLQPVTVPASAADPVPLKPQLAPLNPAFTNRASTRPQSFTAAGEPTRALGLIPTPIDLGHLKSLPVNRSAPQSLTALPSSFDWRTYNKVTTVKDQGVCGTCWIFGNIASVESRALIIDGQSYDLSEQNLTVCTDPSYTYLSADRCGAGGELLMAPDTLTKKGARLESAQPYNPVTINTEACNDSITTILRATDWRLVANSPSQTAEIKTAIYNYGPVSATYVVGSGRIFQVNGKYVYYWPNCSEDPNHLVAIVGWDDTVAHPSGGGSGTFIVKNSWGTSWGNSGYFYLAYGSANLQGIGSFHGSAGYVPGDLPDWSTRWGMEAIPPGWGRFTPPPRPAT
jgi:C1A family cysteine protease/uncharacterized membrane protein YphA (DoxX/SURF4 family)